MKKIVFKFKGGPWDGKTLVGQLGEHDEAERYYLLSHSGRVGQRFRTASQYAIDTLTREQLQVETPHNFQQHYYEVVDRVEEESQIFVRAHYVREADPKT